MWAGPHVQGLPGLDVLTLDGVQEQRGYPPKLNFSYLIKTTSPNHTSCAPMFATLHGMEEVEKRELRKPRPCIRCSAWHSKQWLIRERCCRWWVCFKCAKQAGVIGRWLK